MNLLIFVNFFPVLKKMGFFVTKFGRIVEILLFQKEILFQTFVEILFQNFISNCVESVFLDNIKDKRSARFIIELQ